MSTEKIPIESLKSNLIALPGGITVYDSTEASKQIGKPTLVSELQSQGIQSVSKEDLETHGIRVVSTNEGLRIQFVYPKLQQSLVSFEGTLPAYTYIFTNPSEDPGKHRKELTSEIFQTTAQIDFSGEEPSKLQVRDVLSGATQEISRLGHFISLTRPQATASQFPPNDLRLYLPPVHIPSQHLGDCAADTIQTALFFADGFQEIFAELANTLYKKYITTEPNVLFAVENPKLIEEVKNAFSLPSSLGQKEGDTIAVLASMIRRYILVRLLDFGTTEQIASLNIPPTTCILPGAIGEMGVVKGRRKSINLLTGATIARKISRIFEPSSMIGSDLKLKPTQIHIQLEHDFFCLLFRITRQVSLHSFIFKRTSPISIETDKIRAILFPLGLTKKNSGANSLESGGHSISLFRFNEEWYLQDDNLGIAKPIPSFDIEHYVQHKSGFFLTTYTFLLNKSDLIEQGLFTQDEFRVGKPKRYGYYGYRYITKEGLVKEKILYKDTTNYNARFDSDPVALFLCHGEIDEEQKKKALLRCDSSAKKVSIQQDKPAPIVKSLPPNLLAQMNMPTTNTKAPKKEALSFAEIRQNIQANLSAFNTTRKVNIASSNKNTRKIKSYTNTKILNQFTAF